MKVTIFYSWQSDLPNNTNRGFIESVIEKAIKSINSQEIYELEICLERDTQGAPGSPNIVTTILDKISACDIFIADISIVTGDSERNQRLSPNPNVLIELGYAISHLGWDRIILFCNEIYGKDEKLPFDIQQHRRIGYELFPADEKAPTRDRLSNVLKDSIVQITECLYQRNQVSLPEFSLYWTEFKYEPSKNGIEKKSVTDTTITLLKSSSIDYIISELDDEVREIKQIDGSVDPEWNKKVSKFIEDVTKFKKQFDSKIVKEKYFITENIEHAILVTLSIDNIGSLPATDVRVKVELPEWIFAFDDLPDKDDVPTRPEKPTPKAPVATAQNYSFMNSLSSILNRPFSRPYDMHLPDIAFRNINQTSGCYVKNRIIRLWADKLLHKHELTIDDDSFYFIALPNASLGKHILNAKIFCVEYDDWKNLNLEIEICDGPEE